MVERLMSQASGVARSAIFVRATIQLRLVKIVRKGQSIVLPATIWRN